MSLSPPPSAPPPPPLSLRPSSHPSYAQALAVALGEDEDDAARGAGGGVWDVGCGFGKDLLALAQQGVPPSRLVGFDVEAQFRRLALDQARAAGFASLPYSLLSIDLFADPLPADLPPRPRVILAYRLFHLFPPAEHLPMVRRLLALLDPSRGPAFLLGLHRADVGEFAALTQYLREAPDDRLGSYRSLRLDGPTPDRNAWQWSYCVNPPEEEEAA